MNSRLEIIYPLSIRRRVDTNGATLEQERHETPRPPHIFIACRPPREPKRAPPVLDQIASDSRFVEIARQRARALAERIRHQT
jgi:hypothetical protein